jgi:hypothetical protein
MTGWREREFGFSVEQIRALRALADEKKQSRDAMARGKCGAQQSVQRGDQRANDVAGRPESRRASAVMTAPEAEGVAVADTRAAGEARFVTGNIMRHVVVMAGTGAVGLIAVFAVDLLNLFYISLLGQRPTAAAIGFAGVIGFFQTSTLIGLAIGVGAVVAHSIGAGEARAARHIAGSGLALMVLAGLVVGPGYCGFTHANPGHARRQRRDERPC